MILLPEAGRGRMKINAVHGRGPIGGVADEISAGSLLTMCLTTGLGMRMMTVAYA